MTALRVWNKSPWQRPFSISAYSKNAKLSSVRGGGCAATYASQHTCSKRCPLFDTLCYGYAGMVSWVTKRLNSCLEARPNVIALLEAIAIIRLARRGAGRLYDRSQARPLRVHVIGDCLSSVSAALIGQAVRYYERIASRAWTYTHSWLEGVKASDWQGMSVLASINGVTSEGGARPAAAIRADIAAARRLGYQRYAITIPKHDRGHKLQRRYGLNCLPCPAQFKTASGDRVTACDCCKGCYVPSMGKYQAVLFQLDQGPKASA